jgi:hypothetical protein
MNDLNLPPRRTMPPEVRERLRTRVFADERPARLRAPLAAAAGVAVLAAGAMIVSQSVAGTPADYRPGTSPNTTGTSAGLLPVEVLSRKVTSADVTGPLLPELPPDAHTADDLDRCGAVAAASPRAQEFPPRSAWEPVYTVSRRGHRITAYREYGGKPGFCDVTATTATVSDPSAEPMSLGESLEGEPINTYALYLSDGGLLAGVAQGYPQLGFAVVHSGRRFARPALRNELFVVDVGELPDGDVLQTWAFAENGNMIASSELRFNRAAVRPVGATATDR